MILTKNFVKIPFINYNNKVILVLAQNGYNIRHVILGSDKNSELELNSFYSRFELSQEGIKNLHKLLSNCDVVIINDLDLFNKHANLNSLKIETGNKLSYIMNNKLDVYLPNLNRFYPIFSDKQMLAFSGIFSSLRSYHEYTAPFVPKVNIFVRILFIFF